MDINNISVSNSSRINLNTANRAFEANKKEQSANFEDFKQDDIALMETPKKTVDVADIQKYASQMGETLSIDDINYGLMYGRSVIADYSA